MTAIGSSLAKSALPCGVASLVSYVQGLLVHEAWTSRYGVELSDERPNESHIRRVEDILERMSALDDRPFSTPRPFFKRLVGTCRHFSVLLVALLRQQGVPARARCGFADYFTAGNFEDHWVGEYWSDAEVRWVRVDAQLDDLQRVALNIDFSPLDVPPERFLVAGDAWVRCCADEADPTRFGINGMSGLWFVAANLLRDLAALNKVEMLPWDVWGAMPSPDEPLQAEQLALFEQIAEVTRAPDVSVTDLHSLYEDDRLLVPETVYNAVLGCLETISTSAPNF